MQVTNWFKQRRSNVTMHKCTAIVSGSRGTQDYEPYAQVRFRSQDGSTLVATMTPEEFTNFYAQVEHISQVLAEKAG